MFGYPRRWTLPGTASGYLIVRAEDGPATKGWSRLPAMFARTAVERALASAPSVLYDLHQAIGGTRRTGLGRSALHEHHREIARSLNEAFRSGRLVAYQRTPAAAGSSPKAISRPEPEPATEQWPAEE